MIDLNEYLKKYNTKIKLNETREKKLRDSRDKLKERIENEFIKNEKKKPTFKGQGSFKMKTVINPKDTSDEYDIDYGVYLSEEDVLDANGKKKTPTTVHKWVYDAVNGHTYKTENKNKCIRVKYAPGEQSYSYHVDLPIYFENEGKCYLAVKNEDKWIESNPNNIVEWFREEIKEENSSEQLRVIIRFVKSWVKLNNWNHKKPTGLLITVLCANNFSKQKNDIYDIALYETISNIISFIEKELEKSENEYLLNLPVHPYDNLLKEYSRGALDEFLSKLKTFINNLKKAFVADDDESLQECLKNIFEDIEDVFNDDQNCLQTKAPAIIGNDDRSA